MSGESQRLTDIATVLWKINETLERVADSMTLLNDIARDVKQIAENQPDLLAGHKVKIR